MYTIASVTDHLDEADGDSMSNTLLMLGAKHAMIPGFDALYFA